MSCYLTSIFCLTAAALVLANVFISVCSDYECYTLCPSANRPAHTHTLTDTSMELTRLKRHLRHINVLIIQYFVIKWFYMSLWLPDIEKTSSLYSLLLWHALSALLRKHVIAHYQLLQGSHNSWEDWCHHWMLLQLCHYRPVRVCYLVKGAPCQLGECWTWMNWKRSWNCLRMTLSQLIQY